MDSALRLLIDQSAAMQAHARMQAGRRYLGAMAPDADEQNVTPVCSARLTSGYHCRVCATCDPDRFEPRRRSLCRECRRIQERARKTMRENVRVFMRAPILDALAQGSMTTTQLDALFAADVRTLRRQLAAIEREGDIVCVRRPTGSSPGVWALTTQETKR